MLSRISPARVSLVIKEAPFLVKKPLPFLVKKPLPLLVIKFFNHLHSYVIPNDPARAACGCRMQEPDGSADRKTLDNEPEQSQESGVSDYTPETPLSDPVPPKDNRTNGTTTDIIR